LQQTVADIVGIGWKKGQVEDTSATLTRRFRLNEIA
jgi:hypothetical protein